MSDIQQKKRQICVVIPLDEGFDGVISFLTTFLHFRWKCLKKDEMLDREEGFLLREMMYIDGVNGRFWLCMHNSVYIPFYDYTHLLSKCDMFGTNC